MIICFECTPETKEYLDSILRDGNYKDYGEIITVAIHNLSVFHAEVRDQGSIVLDLTALNIKRAQGKMKTSPLPIDTAAGHFVSSRLSYRAIPQIFRLRPVDSIAPPLAPSPLVKDVVEEDLGLHNWVFGQYNRFLPAKVSCRALANLMSERNAGIPLPELRAHIPEEATKLGDYLKLHDKENSFSRDQSLAIAFPSSSPNVDKSKLRFANQFIAAVDKSGNLSGMLYRFKFINWLDPNQSQIALTEEGWHFSQLMNPILEAKQQSPDQKFSDEEIAYLIKHIATNIPIEISSYRSILSAIKDGNDTPSLLDEVLARGLPAALKGKYSQSFLSSQRSGAVSRMIDLGLIRRIRKGKYIRYRVADIPGEISGYL